MNIISCYIRASISTSYILQSCGWSIRRVTRLGWITLRFRRCLKYFYVVVICWYKRVWVFLCVLIVVKDLMQTSSSSPSYVSCRYLTRCWCIWNPYFKLGSKHIIFPGAGGRQLGQAGVHEYQHAPLPGLFQMLQEDVLS